MVCFGAVVVEPSLEKTTYGQTRPISREFIPEALAVSGFTRKEHEGFGDPATVIAEFGAWLEQNAMQKVIGFRKDSGLFEAAYFRNPGEKAINTKQYYDAIGGDDVVAVKLFQPGNSSSVSGQISADGNGNLAGTLDFNDPAPVLQNQTLQGTYSVGTVAPGRTIVAISTPTDGARNYVAYIVGPGQVLLLETDTNLVGSGDAIRQF